MTVVFLFMPGLNLDFASFSFHVPLKASSAKLIAAVARHMARTARIALPFILPPRSLQGGPEIAADSTALRRREQPKLLLKLGSEGGDVTGTGGVIRCFDSGRVLRC